MNVYGQKETITGTTDKIDSAFTSVVALEGIVVYTKDGDWGDTIDVEVGYGDPWVKVTEFANAVPVPNSSTWIAHRYQNIRAAYSIVPTTVKVRVRYNQADTATSKKVIVHYICQ